MSNFNSFRMLLSIILRIVLGLIGFYLELQVVYSLFGVIGVILGILLFPIVFAITPFVAIFKYGNWTILLVVLATIFIPPLFTIGIDDE